jgi:hypothetical protein
VVPWKVLHKTDFEGDDVGGHQPRKCPADQCCSYCYTVPKELYALFLMTIAHVRLLTVDSPYDHGS